MSDADSQPVEYHDDELYKKYFRSAKVAGLLSIKPWLDAGKVSIDVGKLSLDNKLISSTLVWVNAIELAIFLRAIVSGQARRLYPQANAKAKAMSLIKYGGGVDKNTHEIVARVLKIEPWDNEPNDETCKAWAFKTGHFKGNKTESGAITPDQESPISQDMIRVTLTEIAEISYRLDLALSFLVATDPEWLRKLNGKR